MVEHFPVIWNHFLTRWTLANIIGWSLGLYLGGALLSVLGGIAGAAAGGALAGAFVGAAQWLVLRRKSDKVNPRWALLSAAGGGLATLPAYAAGITLIAGPQVGYFVIGAVYGAIFGGLQALALHRAFEEGSAWWVLANLLAGGLCGCLTMTASLPGLPLICSPGPVVFGLLTGWALLALRRGA
jgi:hypothetical protein